MPFRLAHQPSLSERFALALPRPARPWGGGACLWGAQAAPGLWEVPVEEMVPGFHYRHCFKNLGIPELLAEGGAAQLKE